MVYTVTMANAVVDYTIYSDIRFTKCSESFQNQSDDDLYIYLYDVPGASSSSTGQSCSVNFQPAEYTGASMDCNEAAKMLSYEFGDYAPICNNSNSTKWEPCQCGFSDSTTCVCVDRDSGIPLEDGEIAVVDLSDSSQYSHYSEWCDDHCPNSHYPGLSANAAAVSTSAVTVVDTDCVDGVCSRNDPVNKVPSDNVDWNSLNILIYVLIVVAVAALVLLVAGIIYILGKLCPQNQKYQRVVAVSDTDCV